MGVERASYDPEASVFLRAVYEYYPYTHSLFTNVTIALLVSYIVYKFINKKWAIVTGIAVLSHWFLDVIVHVPDVPVFFDSLKIGLGLWSYPLLTLVLEVGLLTIAFWLFLKNLTTTRTRKWAIGIYLFLTIFYVGSYFAPAIPPTPYQIGIFGLLIYGGIPVAAFFAEKTQSKEQKNGDVVLWQ